MLYKQYITHFLFMYTTQTFIDKAQQIHNNKYNYTKTVYKSWTEKLCIT